MHEPQFVDLAIGILRAIETLEARGRRGRAHVSPLIIASSVSTWPSSDRRARALIPGRACSSAFLLAELRLTNSSVSRRDQRYAYYGTSVATAIASCSSSSRPPSTGSFARATRTTSAQGNREAIRGRRPDGRPPPLTRRATVRRSQDRRLGPWLGRSPQLADLAPARESVDSRARHGPSKRAARDEMGDPGFEPGTSALSERRSNRLLTPSGPDCRPARARALSRCPGIEPPALQHARRASWASCGLEGLDDLLELRLVPEGATSSRRPSDSTAGRRPRLQRFERPSGRGRSAPGRPAALAARGLASPGARAPPRSAARTDIPCGRSLASEPAASS